MFALWYKSNPDLYFSVFRIKHHAFCLRLIAWGRNSWRGCWWHHQWPHPRIPQICLPSNPKPFGSSDPFRRQTVKNILKTNSHALYTSYPKQGNIRVNNISVSTLKPALQVPVLVYKRKNNVAEKKVFIHNAVTHKTADSIPETTMLSTLNFKQVYPSWYMTNPTSSRILGLQLTIFLKLI